MENRCVIVFLHSNHLWRIKRGIRNAPFLCPTLFYAFEGESHGLIVAEIELTSEQEAFEKLEWVEEEVSHDESYTNSALP